MKVLTLLFVLGLALIVAGLASWSVPLALMIAGIFCCVLAVLMYLGSQGNDAK